MFADGAIPLERLMAEVVAFSVEHVDEGTSSDAVSTASGSTATRPLVPAFTPNVKPVSRRPAVPDGQRPFRRFRAALHTT